VLFAAISCSTTHTGQDTKISHDPSGTWVGDFGPAFYDRNTISLELHWDGRALAGMVKPGIPGARMYREFAGFPIKNGNFDPATGKVTFEATLESRNRRYVVEGQLNGDTFNGKWNRPDEVGRSGDFKLKRQN
jgi:hypothetical protein